MKVSVVADLDIGDGSLKDLGNEIIAAERVFELGRNRAAQAAALRVFVQRPIGIDRKP